jgi:hypothetical protein
MAAAQRARVDRSAGRDVAARVENSTAVKCVDRDSPYGIMQRPRERSMFINRTESPRKRLRSVAIHLVLAATLGFGSGCSFRSTDAVRLIECAQAQVRRGPGAAVCRPQFDGPYTVVLLPASGLDADTEARLTADQRAYLRQLARSDAPHAVLWVFRSDETGSGADYIGHYFEVDRPFAVQKAAGESTRIIVEEGSRLPSISGVQ